MTTQLSFKKITKGPSKFDLMVHFFETPRDQGGNRKSTFTVDGQRVEAIIWKLEREDGSGESFNFEGYFGIQNRVVKGHYRTDTRQGTISFYS